MRRVCRRTGGVGGGESRLNDSQIGREGDHARARVQVHLLRHVSARVDLCSCRTPHATRTDTQCERTGQEQAKTVQRAVPALLSGSAASRTVTKS